MAQLKGRKAQTRGEQLARAFLAVARANHNMVGIVAPYTRDELHEAQQYVIDHQNRLTARSRSWDVADLALDLIEQADKRS